MSIFRSLFEVIGPIMVGPSSSHTAGAVRIGQAARSIFGEQPDRWRSPCSALLPTPTRGMARIWP